jgi:uncharacterized linocin/CFP29 family protein
MSEEVNEMDLLKQPIAPISEKAWREISQEAERVVRLNLSGRRILDVSGPLGIETAAVNLGRLDVPDQQPDGVRYGIRRVLPLVELRVEFALDRWELDDIDRGSRDPDLSALGEAARGLAEFEENAVYNGFSPGNIPGLVESAASDPIPVQAVPGKLPDAVAQAVLRQRDAGVEGPYALALGTELWKWLDSGTEQGYPIRGRLVDQVEGPIVLAPCLKGGVLLSRRGGDAELSLGQDVAIGFQGHDEKSVQLFLSESFTFRTITPEAVVVLEREESP